MTTKFTSDFFAANRQRLREAVGKDLIAVAANGLLQRTGDTSFGFRQDNNFWYLTGVDEPDLILVMSADKEFLIVPGRSVSWQAFDGLVDPAELTARSGITMIVDETAGWGLLTKLLRKGRQLATTLPTDSYIEPYGLYANPSRRRFVQHCKRAAPLLRLTDIRSDFAKLRMIKQPVELKAMKQAIALTGKAIETVTERLDSYTHEYQIEADISHIFRASGGEGHAFDPIVAHGANAVRLHYEGNDAKIKKNSLIVIDIGVEVEHYASDVARTLMYGKPSVRQREVYDAVLDVQAAATALLKPGIDLREYEGKVERLIGEKLRQLNVITTDEKSDIRRYYPHAASHFLGLDAHDVGDYQAPLPVNAVITVEPGIYIPEEGIGVRIEDDVLITATGNRVLSASIPRVLQ